MFYRSLSQEQLCKMFDLPDKQVGPRSPGLYCTSFRGCSICSS